MSPTEKIIDKLKKVQNMAEGAKAIGNEAEAQAFAEMFERLLTKHKLTLSDIDFAKLEQEEPVIQHVPDWAAHGWEYKKATAQWQNILARIVADAHYCQIIRYVGTNRFIIVGRKSDAEVAEYAIITLIRAADRIGRFEYGKFYRQCQANGDVTEARGFRDAFMLGFINRLKERYNELKAGNKASGSTALVRIDRERKAVADFMEALKKEGECRDMVSRKRWAMNEAGRRRGREVADSVNLGGKAVKSGGVKGQLS